METTIKPSKGWKSLDFGEVLNYNDLLYFMVLRSIKARYAQSVLGVGWAVIQPLFTTGVFTIIFGNLANMDSDGVPYAVFAFSAIVPWGYFSATLTDSTNSLIGNKAIISKVYFPRIILPLSTALAKLLDFLITFVLLILLLLVFRITPNYNIVFIPLLVLILLASSLGMGMLLSALAVQYRDIKHATNFITSILMYAAPVVYPASKVPEKFIFWYSLNPMVGVIEGFRAAFLGTRDMPWDLICLGGGMGVVIFIGGSLYFRKMERIFADVV